MEKLVDAMSRGSLHALQNVNQRERPALFIPKWGEQQMDVVRHDDDSMQTYPRCRCGAGALARHSQNSSLSETVCQHQISGQLRQDHSSAGTEGHKQGRVRLLQVWEPPAVPVLREGLAGGHAGLIVWGGRPRPPSARSVTGPLIFVCDI